jgi:SLOG-like protein/TIR domain-containing protein
MNAPIAVYFVWHPADSKEVQPLVDYVFKRFQRDTDYPFSRSMNLPVFFRTSSNNNTPKEIKSATEKNVIFCFSSVNVTGRDEWKNYYDTFFGEGNYVVPIAMNSEYGFNLNTSYERKNYIRLYDFNPEFIQQIFFTYTTHEIFRFCFNLGGTASGEGTALKLFLSHAKNDSWAVNLATKLKDYIDNSPLRRFFDAHDIHPAHYFDDEIEVNLKESTLISIHSDSYSSRYWCKKEVMVAKNNQRPMVIVNHVKDCEDRTFTHSVNVPSARVESNDDIGQKDIYRILEMALLETLRHNYHNKQLEGFNGKKVLIMTSPPELSDIPRLLSCDSKGKIEKVVDEILYPDPQVYEDELRFLESFSIRAVTPLTRENISLKDVSIGISISDPAREELLNLGHDERHIINLSQSIARSILFSNGTLTYGGDLRPSGFTEYLFEEAKIVQDILKEDKCYIKNFISWPIYKADTETIFKWKSKYNKIAEMIEVKPHDIVTGKDIESFLPPSNPDNRLIWSLCLTKMRNEMIAACDVRICAGGKLSGYKGKYPGVLEEIDIAIQHNKPIYLIGGFGGVTSRVCDLLLSHTVPEELTTAWQINNTPAYNELVEKISKNDDYDNVNYDAIVKNIKTLGLKGISKNNGLTPEQNLQLFKTQFVDEAISLILQGVSQVIA